MKNEMEFFKTIEFPESRGQQLLSLIEKSQNNNTKLPDVNHFLEGNTISELITMLLKICLRSPKRNIFLKEILEEMT
jgi:hypothetical protein